MLRNLEHVYGRNRFHTIRLNGELQKEDSDALMEFSRQLTSDSSHRVHSSIDAHMEFISSTMRDCADKNYPIFIILENFEVFASHAKQVLLYNLLDQTQVRVARIQVIHF